MCLQPVLREMSKRGSFCWINFMTICESSRLMVFHIKYEPIVTVIFENIYKKKKFALQMQQQKTMIHLRRKKVNCCINFWTKIRMMPMTVMHRHYSIITMHKYCFLLSLQKNRYNHHLIKIMFMSIMTISILFIRPTLDGHHLFPHFQLNFYTE